MDEKVVRQEVKYLEPIISERRMWNMHYVVLAFIIGLFIVLLDVFFIIYFSLEALESVTVSSILVAIYSIFLFFLIEPYVLRQVQERAVMMRVIQGPEVVRTVEKPVIRVVEKPVFKEVVRTVDRPVVRTVERPIYIEKKRKMPDVRHYKYVGSTLTKKYHSIRSRLSRLIKNENKVYANSSEEFERKGFKPARDVIKKFKGKKKKIALKKYKAEKKK